MVFLPGLAVVFVGIVGNNAGKVEHQVKVLLADAHVQTAAMPAAEVATLAHHGEGCGDIVRRLHVDGVVGGELFSNHGHQSLRVAIYAGDGGLKSFAEIPLGGRVLSNDELDVLRSNLEDDVLALAKAAPVVAPPAPAPTRTRVEKPITTAMDDENPFEKSVVAAAPKREAEPKLLPRRTIAAAASAPPNGELSFPDETISHETSAHEPAPVQTADASESVSADDIEALMRGGEVGGGGGAIQASTSAESTLRLHAAIGIGLASRSFAPGPAAVQGYESSPVGAIHFEAGVQPTPHTGLAVFGESTLQMATPMGNAMASTTMSRWEAVASYAAVRGAFELAPQIGVGRRSFSIDSTDPSRSPDGDYNYLIAGATASIALGSHVTLRAIAAFEPVISGSEPTEMAFGKASRWAVDVGAALEARPLAHVFVRAAADYQRFTWSWDMAGARGAGGAVDAYPSGTLSLGAEY
jgi:hypothetical protein